MHWRFIYKFQNTIQKEDNGHTLNFTPRPDKDQTTRQGSKYGKSNHRTYTRLRMHAKVKGGKTSHLLLARTAYDEAGMQV